MLNLRGGLDFKKFSYDDDDVLVALTLTQTPSVGMFPHPSIDDLASALEHRPIFSLFP